MKSTTHPHTPRSRRAAGLALLGTATWLVGCADWLPKPPAAPARHTLGGTVRTAVPALAGGAEAPSLSVAVPLAAAGYDSPRMLYQRQPQRLEAFAFHQWAESPVRLLAPLLVQALQQRGAFRVVLQAPSAATSTLRLETELLHLHLDHTVRPGQWRVAMRAVLIDLGTRQALATRVFEASAEAAAGDPADGMPAAALATQRVLDALADFVAAEAVSAVRPGLPPLRRPGG